LNKHMNGSNRTKPLLTGLIIVIVVLVIVAATLWADYTFQFESSPFRPRAFPAPPEEYIPYDLEFFYTVETVASTVNVTLSFFLLLMYVNIYRKTRSEFTIGLIIFSAVLLLHAFVLIPLVHRAFGFYEFGLGPFAMLPDLFTSLALGVLLYLTFKY
jgi:hypothetical protein